MSKREEPEKAVSDLETALEDEYLYKYHVLISEELDEEEWTRVAERVNKLKRELQKG